MNRETWRNDLWMAYKIQHALAHNKTICIITKTVTEKNRLKRLFKNVPVKIKVATRKFGGIGFGTVIMDECK